MDIFGKIVKNKFVNTYGVINYSSFGCSIHFLMNFDNSGEFGLAKTIGMTYEEMLEHWDIVDMPEGYKIGKYGCVELDG